ncbi:PepSY domain-containing protein [Ensifer adhaerens]|uniref:PepSY domain-containing protein n=1 Tax=Ensifer adhaerens TaxID=106592 RepID=UPI00098F24E9|nr:PepSY domain-containing protein [Ensifer adhaerens]
MKNVLLAAVFLGASTLGALAQTSSPPATADGDTPAVATPDTTNPTAPVAGANSFTEAQVKDRLTEAGYTEVTGLKLDDKGVWRAAAMKDGKSVAVALDYQGNIVAN